jgi:molybdopterin molybdotransferase
MPICSPDRDTVLPVTGRAAAGHPLGRAIERGEAIRIFTGAPMPEGADTVMMQEDCTLAGGTVTLKPGIRKGANRRHAGEDVAKGGRARRRTAPQARRSRARRRARPRPADGLQKLRVALLSTGDEVREPGHRCPRARSTTPTASCWQRC